LPLLRLTSPGGFAHKIRRSIPHVTPQNSVSGGIPISPAPESSGAVLLRPEPNEPTT
jgi:hypothetical protein